MNLSDTQRQILLTLSDGDCSCSPEDVYKLINYDPQSGKLFWKYRDLSYFRDGITSAIQSQKAWNNRYSGRNAFTALKSNGYHHGSIFGKTYTAHRVAWALSHGAWPQHGIDHINGVRTDNRLNNLRDVPPSINAKNCALPKNNKSGQVGVCWNVAGRFWRVRIGYKHVGNFHSLTDAIAARKNAERINGYHEKHGKSHAMRCGRVRQDHPGTGILGSLFTITPEGEAAIGGDA